jgi:hypothetical protein
MESEDENVPMPVINRTAAIVDGEASRLIASTHEPRIDANDRTTRVTRAARLSGQVVESICRENNWVRVSHQDRKDCVIYGTSFLLTSLDLDMDSMESVPAPTFACKDCDWKISADKASFEDGMLSIRGEAAQKMGAELPENATEEQRRN